jgi:hypothetical protein
VGSRNGVAGRRSEIVLPLRRKDIHHLAALYDLEGKRRIARDGVTVAGVEPTSYLPSWICFFRISCICLYLVILSI